MGMSTPTNTHIDTHTHSRLLHVDAQANTESKWLVWEPDPTKFCVFPDDDLTKLTPSPQPVLMGTRLAENPASEPVLNREKLTLASSVLGHGGVRIMTLETGVAIGLWSDLDGPEVRAALRVFGSDHLPVVYLDGPGVPPRFKLRRVAGEPVPLDVLHAMEQNPEEPWIVRYQMLSKMGWCPNGQRRQYRKGKEQA
jgi:hypothetical protein